MHSVHLRRPSRCRFNFFFYSASFNVHDALHPWRTLGAVAAPSRRSFSRLLCTDPDHRRLRVDLAFAFTRVHLVRSNKEPKSANSGSKLRCLPAGLGLHRRSPVSAFLHFSRFPRQFFLLLLHSSRHRCVYLADPPLRVGSGPCPALISRPVSFA